MNNMITFNFNNNPFRAMIENGEPLILANDAAVALGYSNPSKAINDHCKGVTKRYTPTSSGDQLMNYIPESDLYRLIFRSKLPSAEKFETWVTSEVLPQIRKTGSYTKPLSQDQQLLQLAQGVIRLTQERDAAIKEKAYINDKRTATLMNKASQDAKRIKKLEDQLQDQGDYLSVIAADLPQRVDTELKPNIQSWRVLKEISNIMERDIKKTKDPRYGEVNTYHIDVIEAFKKQYC